MFCGEEYDVNQKVVEAARQVHSASNAYFRFKAQHHDDHVAMEEALNNLEDAYDVQCDTLEAEVLRSRGWEGSKMLDFFEAVATADLKQSRQN